MTESASNRSTCPSCGAVATGKFCAECGAALRGGTCAGCSTALTPGAHFCHNCGRPANTATASASAPAPVPAASGPGVLPWSIAGLALLAVVAILAGQQFGANRGEVSTPGRVSLSEPAATGTVPATTDISAMTPRERADRLFNRIMRLASENKRDSILFFAPMALGAYQALGPLDNDLRFDYGRVAEVSGELDIAKAQADTILRVAPNHLLGLVLALRVAEQRNDQAQRQQIEKKLLDVIAAERAKGLEEYERHRGEIDAALEQARRSSSGRA